jgi:hypothetical protein
MYLGRGPIPRFCRGPASPVPSAVIRRYAMAVNRKVTTTAVISGVDHETWGDNERGSAARTTERVLFDNNQQELSTLICKWGGECRVELFVNGKREDNNDVFVSGVAVLYEGTSEDTSDEDGRQGFGFVVPKGRTVSQGWRVVNLDEGDDYADFNITVVNSVFED